MVADRYFWISVCPGTCPDAPICWRVPPCTLLPRCRAGSRNCRETGRSRFIAFADFRSVARAVTELRQRGYDARALVGGITAWHAIGGATVPLDASTYEEAP
jgi:hypothetical protein